MDHAVSSNGIVANSAVISMRIKERNEELAQLQSKIDNELNAKRNKAAKFRVETDTECQKLQRQLDLVYRRGRKEMEDLERSPGKTIKNLENQLRELEVKIKRDKELIAPIKKLPAELLSYIFQQFVFLGQPPLILTGICKSWKQIAVTTPRLWSNLCLGKPSGPTGNRVVCRDAEELQWFALLSGKAPLDVALNANGGHLLSCLLSGTLSQRILSLSLDSTVDADKLDTLVIPPFPHLQYLALGHLRGSLIDSILLTILRPYTPLSSLTLAGVRPASLATMPWASLRTLQVSNPHTTPDDFNQIISRLSLIETLRGCPTAWPNNDTPNVTMRARSMEVICQPEFLARLGPSQLQTLQWTNPSPNGLHRAYVADSYLRSWELSFPELVSLGFSGNCAAWLARFSAPQLHTLRWIKKSMAFPHVQLTDDPPVSPFPTTHLPNIENFCYDASSDRVLLSVLQCIPNVRVLSLSPGEFKASKYTDTWEVDILRRLADPVNMLCPRVETLTLGTKRRGIHTGKSLMMRPIKDVIRIRKELGRPLKLFETTWSASWSNKEAETTRYT